MRRNANGRIIGLYLQAPTNEDWLAPTRGRRRRRRRHGGGHHGDDDGRQLLTKEQVMEFPEIQYTRPATAHYAEDEVDYEDGNKPADDGDAYQAEEEGNNNDLETGGGSGYNVTASTTTPSPTSNNDPTKDESIRIQMMSTDEDDDDETPTTATPSNNGATSDEGVGPQGRDGVDGNSGAVEDGEALTKSICDQHTQKVYTTTTSTTCSICIDEFEEGELVRLLPRCGHAYHTECILPWLTERQGCCPLCKIPVLTPSLPSSSQSLSSSSEEQQTEPTRDHQDNSRTDDAMEESTETTTDQEDDVENQNSAAGATINDDEPPPPRP